MSFKTTLTALTIACSAILFPVQSTATTVKDAVMQVLESNPEVLASGFNRRAIGAEVKQARSGYFPTLDLILGIGREKTDSPATRAAGTADETMTRREAGIKARQMIFDGFGTSNEVKRQKAREKAAAYSVYATAEQLSLDAVRAYLDVLRNEDFLQLTQENLSIHRKIADQVETRSSSGMDRAADSDQAKGRLALAQSNVVAAEANLVDAKNTYFSIIGASPESLERPASNSAIMPASTAEAEQMALESHPTLLSAHADVEQAEAQHDAAQHSFYPRLDLEYEQNWDQDIDGTDGDYNQRLLMLRLRYNLINGGKDRARREETAYLINQAKEIRNQTHRQVVESIRLSMSAYEAINDQMKYLESHVSSSVKTRDAYQQQFSIGRRTLLDVLDTENEVFEAKKDLIDAQYDALAAEYRVLVGMGKLLKTLQITAPEEAKLASE